MSNEWILAPYVFDHRTKEEGSRTKCHITTAHSETGKTLCGLSTLYKGGGTLHSITLEWLNFPDPSEQLCKHCKKSAIKILTPQTPHP